VPGFVYQITRRRLQGPAPDEVEFGVRILRAIVTSAVFAGFYLLVLGQRLIDAVTGSGLATEKPRLVALAGLMLVVMVPLVSAQLVYYLTTSAWWGTLVDSFVTKLGLRRPYDPTPGAWDAAFIHREPGWVRVLTTDGVWVGGYFGTESFASSFPHPRELYIECAYEMSEDGSFTGKMSAAGGVYVRCDDIRLVEFPTGAETEGSTTQSEPDGGHRSLLSSWAVSAAVLVRARRRGHTGSRLAERR
jgi:hypothetical protein